MSKVPPLRFRGRDLQAAKSYTHGTHRTVSPDVTMECVRPLLSRIGVTRLANITGLDRAGVPVVLAIRPNSRTLSNSAGKGITLAAARVSAAMEALEMYCAEHVHAGSAPRSYREISAEYSTIPAEHLPSAKYDLLGAHLPQQWMLGWDLMQQREVAVPLTRVSLGPISTGFDRMALWSDTNGLASGNNLLEAMTSGLLELIERDAVACHWVAWERTGQLPPRVIDTTIQFSRVQNLLEQLRSVEIGVVLYDCTVDTCVPAYLALLFDRRERHAGIFRGAGAHLDPEVALLRAITEAVQARVVYTAGSRDDVSRRGLVAARLHDNRKTLELLTAGTHTAAARDYSEATPTFEGDMQLLLTRLLSAGISDVIAFDLTPPECDVSVIRVIAPGLEGFLWHHFAPGWRAAAFIGANRQ